MYTVTFYPDELSRDLLSAELFDQGCEGISETSISLRAFFYDRGLAESAAAQFLHFDPEIEQIEDKDYTADWLAQWPPMLVGERWFLVPDWRKDETPAGRLKLPIHPGQAFGTGKHQSTQLCLAAMELIPLQDRHVLDLGTGSGVLSTAAWMLGAAQVRASDIDADSVAVARENCALDGAPVEFFVGSIDQVADASVDVLLANILAPTHRELGGDYARVLRAGGHLIVSGFESHEVDEVRASVGLRELHDLQQDTWHALVLVKE